MCLNCATVNSLDPFPLQISHFQQVIQSGSIVARVCRIVRPQWNATIQLMHHYKGKFKVIFVCSTCPVRKKNWIQWAERRDIVILRWTTRSYSVKQINKFLLSLSSSPGRTSVYPTPMEDDLHSPSSPIYLGEDPEVSPRTENGDCTGHNR